MIYEIKAETKTSQTVLTKLLKLLERKKLVQSRSNYISHLCYAKHYWHNLAQKISIWIKSYWQLKTC